MYLNPRRLLLLSGTAVFFSSFSVAYATDQGPRESTSPGTVPVAVQPGAPSAPTSVPGPLPSEKIVPVVSPGRAEEVGQPAPMTPQAREERIQQIQKQLSNKKLSKQKRRQLQQELTDLRVKLLSDPATNGTTAGPSVP